MPAPIHSFIAQNPTAKILIFQIAGILSAQVLDIPQIWVLSAAVMSLLSALFFRHSLFVAASIFLVSFGSYSGFKQKAAPAIPLHQEIKLALVVERISERIDYLSADLHFSGQSNSKWIRMTWPELLAEPGDTLLLIGSASLPNVARNPHAFDYRKYLHNQNVALILEYGYEVQSIRTGSSSFKKWIFQVRQKIKSTIRRSIPEPYSGVMTALLLGEKGLLNKEMKERFRQAGVVHILAVSGLHVGYILLILQAFTSIFPKFRLLRLMLVSAGIVFFVVLTGASPSVMRAGFMAILLSYANYRQRDISSWNLLFFAAIVSLAIFPEDLFSAGFWLSFSAVSGIFYAYPQLDSAVWKLKKKFPFLKRGIFSGLIAAIQISIAAQIGTFLPVAFLFHLFPVWSIFANIFIIPLAGIAVLAGVLQAVASIFSNAIADVFGNSAYATIWLMDEISKLFNRLPHPFIHLQHFTSIQLIVLFLLLLIAVSATNKRWFAHTLIASLLFANFFSWQRAFKNENLKIVVLDVDQGDSIFLSHAGRNILVDTGNGGYGRDYGRLVVAPYLEAAGVSNIDLLLLTHPHADHVGGVLSGLKNCKVSRVWDTENNYRSSLYLQVCDSLRAWQIPIDYPLPGQTYRLADMRLTLLAPQPFEAANVHNINNASLVFLLEFGKNTFLFTGDAEVESERSWAKALLNRGVDLIKVGHHGSKTSGGASLRAATQPKDAIISCGVNNKFNHPAPVTIDNWKKLGAKIFRTDEDGALVISADKNSYEIIPTLPL